MGLQRSQRQSLCLQRGVAGRGGEEGQVQNKSTPKQDRNSTSRGVLARHLGIQRKCVSPFCSSSQGEMAVKLGLEGWKALFLKRYRK